MRLDFGQCFYIACLSKIIDGHIWTMKSIKPVVVMILKKTLFKMALCRK